jgi:molybdate transport system substrate-binding protein
MRWVARAVFGWATAALALTIGSSALAADVQVAVAANFTGPAKQIAAAFEARTHDHVALSFGASGQFYAQISHGAPFELFLSADADRPAQAEKEGFAGRGTRFTYAVGKLVLFSKTAGLVDAKAAVLKSDKFQKLAIADPAVAPYGVAAVQTMTKLGVYDAIKPKLVQGTSINQTYQFVQTGAAELGFVALSQVIADRSGSRWIVPEADHAPIEQQAVLLKPGQDDAAARAFLAFLKGPEARQVIRKFGYGIK